MSKRPTKGKAIRKKAKVWSLDTVQRKCSAAAAVWIALLDLSAERRSKTVTPTRKDLSERTGITRFKTISSALTTLEAAAWIDRVHVPVTVDGQQTATMLRLALRRRGRYAPHTGKSAVEGARRPIGEGCRRGRHAPQDSSYGRERDTPALNAGGVAQTPLDTDQLLQQGLEMDRQRKLRAQQRQAAQQEDAELAKRLGFVDVRELQELTDMLDDHWLKAEPT